jgi:hypothetical protein
MHVLIKNLVIPKIAKPASLHDARQGLGRYRNQIDTNHGFCSVAGSPYDFTPQTATKYKNVFARRISIGKEIPIKTSFSTFNMFGKGRGLAFCRHGVIPSFR